MNRTANRLFLRLAMLCVAIILGGVAVSQAQKGLKATGTETAVTATPTAATETTPIPPRSFENPDVYGDTSPPASTMASGFSESTAAPAYGGAEVDYGSNEPDFSGLPAAPSAPDDASNGYAQSAPAYGNAPTADLPPTDLPPADVAYTANPPAAAYGAPDAFGDQGYAASSPTDHAAPEYAAEPTAAVASNGYGAEVAAAPTTSGYGDPVGYGSAPVQYVEDSGPAMAAPPALVPANDSVDSALPPIDELPAEPALDLPPAQPAPAFGEAEFSNEPNLAEPAYAAGGEDVDAAYGSGAFDNPQVDNGYTGSASMQITRREFQPTPETEAGSLSTRLAARDSNASRGNSDLAGNGKPGPSELEGPQTPTLTVAKAAPKEIQVGKPAKFQVTVRNVGPVDANDVMIFDEIPHGTKLVQTTPQAQLSPDGKLTWEMGTIRSGAEVTATMEVVPLVEGEIGSIARISFNTAATARSTATKPQLLLEHTGPGQVLIGQDVVFHIRLSNPGTGCRYQRPLGRRRPRRTPPY